MAAMTPEEVLKASTAEVLMSGHVSELNSKPQFLSRHLKELEKFGIGLEDIEKLDKIHLYNSYLPFLQTRIAHIKKIKSQMSEEHICNISDKGLNASRGNNSIISNGIPETGAAPRKNCDNTASGYENKYVHNNKIKTNESVPIAFNNQTNFKPIVSNVTPEANGRNGPQNISDAIESKEHNFEKRNGLGCVRNGRNTFKPIISNTTPETNGINGHQNISNTIESKEHKFEKRNGLGYVPNGSNTIKPIIPNTTPEADGRNGPRHPQHPSRFSPGNSQNTKENMSPHRSHSTQSRESISSENSAKKSEPRSHSTQSSESVSSDENKYKTNINKRDETKSDNIIVGHEHNVNPIVSNLSSEVCEVIFGDKNEAFYFVSKKSDQPEIELLSEKLKQANKTPWTQASKETKIAVEMNGKYYRALYLKKTETPDPFVLKLVDVGWFVSPNCTNVNMYVLPEEYRSRKPIAYRVKTKDERNIPRHAVATIAETGQIVNQVKCIDIVKITADLKLNGTTSTNDEKPLKETPVTCKPDVEANKSYKYKDAPISQGQFELNKRIKMMYLGPDEADPTIKLVQDLSILTIYDLFQELGNCNVQFKGMPELGDYCATLYDNEWCRAKVTSVSPLTLFYIDYGNVQVIESAGKIKPLPAKLSAFRPLVMRIKFHHGHNATLPLENGSQFDVTPVACDKDIYIVLKDDETIQTVSSNPSEIKSNHGTKYFYSNDKISHPNPIELNKAIKVLFVEDDHIDATHKWVQYSEIIEQFIPQAIKIAHDHKQTFDRMPEINEFCLSEYENVWYRAKVTNLQPITVLYLDFGNSEIVTDVKKLKTLPQELAAEQPAAFKIKFFHESNLATEWKMGAAFSVTPVEIVDQVPIVLKDNEEILTTTDLIKSRINAISVVQLELKKPVRVMYVQDDMFDDQLCFVQEESNLEKLALFQEVLPGDCGEYEKFPEVGESCIKSYEDAWSRAKVVAVNPPTIFYIDFGNTETVENLEDLKPLSKELSQYLPLSFRIKFENEPKPAFEYGDAFTFIPSSLSGNVYSGIKN